MQLTSASAVAAHGQCALKSGGTAADAHRCDTAGANETLCHLANATCTWVSAADEARLERDYELELWLPIAGIVLVVLCPLLWWPLWCGKQRSSLQTPIITAAAASINSGSAAEVTRRHVDEAAKIAAAHAFHASFLADEDDLPRRVDPGQGRQQLPHAKPATASRAPDTVVPVVAPLVHAGTLAATAQVDDSVEVECCAPLPERPSDVLPTSVSSSTPTQAYRRGSLSPTNSEASSINSDDFDDVLEHDC